MGRFFLFILGLQSVDKFNFLMQEFFIYDLSLPYWEIRNNVPHKSIETKVCIVLGMEKVFCDYMSQLYSFWLAVLIK
jgi:hypothetical protein